MKNKKTIVPLKIYFAKFGRGIALTKKRRTAPKVSGPKPKPGGGRQRKPRYARPKR